VGGELLEESALTLGQELARFGFPDRWLVSQLVDQEADQVFDEHAPRRDMQLVKVDVVAERLVTDPSVGV
jgi:hypothetical protein